MYIFQNQTALIRVHIELRMAPFGQTSQSHFVSGQVLPDVCPAIDNNIFVATAGRIKPIVAESIKP